MSENVQLCLTTYVTNGTSLTMIFRRIFISLFCLLGAEIAAAAPRLFSTLAEAQVKGFVFYADGVTPAEGVPVRVYSLSEKRVLHETVTDEFGYYELPYLAPGRYWLAFNWMKLGLEMRTNGEGETQQPHDVIVVIPRGLATVSLSQLTALLVGTTLTQGAMMYEAEEIERPPIVSP